jgi:hypothetical protein
MQLHSQEPLVLAYSEGTLLQKAPLLLLGPYSPTHLIKLLQCKSRWNISIGFLISVLADQAAVCLND